MKPNIKLKKFLEILQGCYDKHKDQPECADNIEVEFWRNGKPVELKSIGQFGLKPDVTIHLKS
jgi:hypothetical protein